MIKDKDVVIAEDPIEALWIRAKESCEKRLEDIGNTMIIEKAFLEMANKKLKR